MCFPLNNEKLKLTAVKNASDSSGVEVCTSSAVLVKSSHVTFIYTVLYEIDSFTELKSVLLLT